MAIVTLNIDLADFYSVRRLHRKQLIVFNALRCHVLPKLARLTEVHGAYALITISIPIWQTAA